MCSKLLLFVTSNTLIGFPSPFINNYSYLEFQYSDSLVFSINIISQTPSVFRLCGCVFLCYQKIQCWIYKSIGQSISYVDNAFLWLQQIRYIYYIISFPIHVFPIWMCTNVEILTGKDNFRDISDDKESIIIINCTL